MAAAVYIVCSVLWDIVVWGFTAWLVFFDGHSGWWFLLAVVLTWGSTTRNASKIAGTWKPEHEEKTQ